jgi:GntR family transcriptional regulator, rspAB operon transcriptional repressor
MAASVRPVAFHRPAPAESVQAAGVRLYADLHGDIITGRLRPGANLSETKVAEHYGISRTPVREVFRRLAEEGFLRVVPQVATYVAPINLAAVTDSQFIRETLECRAVALSAEKAGPREIRALRQELKLQEQAIAAGNRARFFASDEAMHRILMTTAGYPAVWDLIGSAKAQLDRVRHLSLEQHDWLEMIFRQHRSIVDRTAAHDAVGAEAAMREHLRTVFAAVERIAAEHAEFFDQPRQKRTRRP